MPTKITIDPVTRIEGHLKIEVEINNGVVTDAWSSGTLFRGVEKILQGREPEDAWLFTQRLCGVCTYVHGASSTRCVEDAINLQIPDNARIIRNLLMGGQYVHDHPVHFYHLHALDFVDIVSALSADPAATAQAAAAISSNPPPIDYAEVKQKLETFVNSGQLGPFARGYWGHSAYTLTPEENLLLAAHYLYALRIQVDAAKMHAIFGAKNPHLQSMRVGGVTCEREITAGNIAKFRNLLTQMRNFIDNVYIPDVMYAAKKYPEYGSIGGFKHYLAYGEFQLGNNEPADLYFPRGVIMNQDITNVQDVTMSKITEHITHSWYSGDNSRHPSNGQTRPNYTEYDGNSKYSWLKAPRYKGEPMEVGPLARVLVAYGKEHGEIVDLVNYVLDETGLGVSQLHSTIGRVAARAIETKVIADAMDSWLNGLSTGEQSFTRPTIQANVSGYGLNEAPRGALGHWITTNSEGKIGKYQMVVPTTWNCGPRCTAGKRGPVEEALIGTPVANFEQPVEILRVVHSFDPCVACAVHLIDKDNNKKYEVKVL